MVSLCREGGGGARRLSRSRVRSLLLADQPRTLHPVLSPLKGVMLLRSDPPLHVRVTHMAINPTGSTPCQSCQNRGACAKGARAGEGPEQALELIEFHVLDPVLEPRVTQLWA